MLRRKIRQLIKIMACQGHLSEIYVYRISLYTLNVRQASKSKIRKKIFDLSCTNNNL
jgi:hypothetical protein